MSRQYLEYFDSFFSSVSGSSALIFAVLFLLLFFYITNDRKKKYNLPPGPVGIPIFGYLPFLGKETFKTFDRLKLKYGNVFSLHLGRTYVVVLADYEAVKEGFGKNATLNRPEDVFSFLPDGVGFSSVNDEEWAEQRRFCLKSIRDLGVGKREWEASIQEEIEDFIKLVGDYKGQAFDASDIVTSSVSNNISYFVFGRRLDSSDPDRKLLDESLNKIMRSFLLVSVYAFFPRIRDLFGYLEIGSPGQAYKDLQGFNRFIRKEANKQKRTYELTPPTNFIEDYLLEMYRHKGKTGHRFVDRNLYGNIQALYLASSDTTRTSINWLLLAMAEYQEIQAKIYQELSSTFRRGEQINWSDRNKVPYTMATILEGQRWKTIAPINTPRIAMEDIKIQGYDIPKGTTILANSWGLHHDRRYWKQPESFYPNHFLSEDGSQVIMKPDSYNPFSYGKRSCPGEMIALMEIFLYFSALMVNFQVLPPEDQKVKMDAIAGLTYIPVRQKLRFLPRKSHQ